MFYKKNIVIGFSVLVCLMGWVDAYARNPHTLIPFNRMKMYNIDKQTLDYSCGAASLAILLSHYFGDSIDESTILSEIVYRLSDNDFANRTQKGFSMLDLKMSAIRLGYAAEGVILGFDDIKHLKGPAIILLKQKSSSHFVVLKGVAHGRAYIADPIRGNLKIPKHELNAIWKGETLVVGIEGEDIIAKHGLNIPMSNKTTPEDNITRSLIQIPIN